MAARTTTAVKAQTPAAAAAKASSLVVHENYAPADPVAGGRGKGFPSIFKANPKEKQYTWEEVAQHNTGQTGSRARRANRTASLRASRRMTSEQFSLNATHTSCMACIFVCST
jgi:hypothetical protein